MITIESVSDIIIPQTSLLEFILSCDEEILSIALGDFGPRLLRFAKDVDHSHPHLQGFLDNELVSYLYESIKLVNLAVENGIQKPLEDFSKLVHRRLPKKFKHLDSPKVNQRMVRLMYDPVERERIRLTKHICDINLSSFYNKKSSFWEAVPDDFSCYERNSKKHKESIKLAEDMAKTYENLGCIKMAEKIWDSISYFNSVMEDNYYGFHRLPMTNAALVLAKMHGCELESYSRYNKRQRKTNRLVKLTLSLDRFGEDFIGKKGDYCPKAYSLSSVEAPLYVKEEIKKVEQFEEIGGYPIFDYFAVVVPSILENFEEFDNFVLRENSLMPIVLGEKDGKCYFICYWREYEN